MGGFVAGLPDLRDEGSHHVADADDPEHVSVFHDRHVADLLLAHQPGRVDDLDVRGQGQHPRRHHVAHLDLSELRALAREAEDVALGEDPDQLVALADGHGAHVFLVHARDRELDGLVRPHRHDPDSHGVGDPHAPYRVKPHAPREATISLAGRLVGSEPRQVRKEAALRISSQVSRLCS